MSQDFSQRILTWFDHHGRRDLPWQINPSPYRVWVSEIMLQQTQVNTVIPYFQRFMAQLPNLKQLADAPLDNVLHLWSGLGYYARARHLHRAAELMCTVHHGQVPADFSALQALPGIGRSTAGAILALAYGQCHAILDGNVKRVLCRYHALEQSPGAASKELWQLAETHTPSQQVGAYTQAMMDMGATVCMRAAPRCHVCPVQSDCRAHATGSVSAYPRPRPPKNLPLKSCFMLFLQNPHGQILLQQRPPTGLWGGLWSAPEISTDTLLHAWCHARLGTLPGYWHGAPVRHSFTHFHLDIRPVHIKLDVTQTATLEKHLGADILWYNPRQPPVCGLAAPVARLLKQISTQGE
jgi:A/G-specific adenine glycosylase